MPDIADAVAVLSSFWNREARLLWCHACDLPGAFTLSRLWHVWMQPAATGAHPCLCGAQVGANLSEGQQLSTLAVRARAYSAAAHAHDMRLARAVLLRMNFDTVAFSHHLDPWSSFYTREMLSLERTPVERDQLDRRPCPPDARMRWGWNHSKTCAHCMPGAATPLGRRCCGEACSTQRCAHLL